MRRVCPRCAAHLPGEAEACPACGAAATPPPAAVTPPDQEDAEGLPLPARVVFDPDDPDAPTYVGTTVAPEVQSQWVSKAGAVGARVGLGCGGLLGGISLALSVYQLLFGGRGSGEDVLLAVLLLVAGTPLAALAGAVAFSCLAICLEAPAAAVARLLRRDAAPAPPPRSALAKTDSLGRSAPREGRESRTRRPRSVREDEDGTRRKDGVERRDE